MKISRPSPRRRVCLTRWRRETQLAVILGLAWITACVVIEYGSQRSLLVTKPLEMAWLMSYPNSGTTYTLSLVSGLSQTHTASVYAKESERSGGEPLVRVFADDLSSPYWVQSNPNATFPTRFVLTKTHCGNRENHLAPEAFLDGCRTITQPVSARVRRRGRHSVEALRKAIHLIRDPFDNVVSRFRFERRHAEYAGYDPTPQGFRQYCENHDDSRSLPRELDLHQTQWKMLEDVPCRMELIRYFQWHNMAFRTTRALGLETMMLHYADYTTDFDGTVQRLLDFLELPQKATPTPFIDGKVYRDYFTVDEQRAVKEVYESMASPEAKEEMSVYFESVS